MFNTAGISETERLFLADYVGRWLVGKPMARAAMVYWQWERRFLAPPPSKRMERECFLVAVLGMPMVGCKPPAEVMGRRRAVDLWERMAVQPLRPFGGRRQGRWSTSLGFPSLRIKCLIPFTHGHRRSGDDRRRFEWTSGPSIKSCKGGKPLLMASLLC